MAKKVDIPAYQSNPFMLCFESFGRFFNKNAAWAVTLLVFGLFAFFIQMGSNLTSTLSSNSTSTSERQERAAEQRRNEPVIDRSLETSEIIAIVVIISIAVLTFLAFAITAGIFLQGMFTYVAVRSELGLSVSFKEAVAATSQKFWLLLGAQVLAWLKIIGWGLLFIIPGIIAAFRYTLLPYVIMSDDAQATKVGESHQRTKTLVKGRLLEVFGISTVSGLIPLVGDLLGLTGNAALHQQLQAYDKAGLEKPNIHWLNYLGFILFGLILLLVIFVAGIVLLVTANK